MGSRRIIATEEAEEDIRIEGSLRPQSLDEYIGQDVYKRQFMRKTVALLRIEIKYITANVNG